MKKLTIIWLIVTCSLLADEPSAFGAGNLDSATPYGLTSSEKHILKNRDKVQNLTQGIGEVKTELSRIDENYEGLRSIVEGFGPRISKMSQQIQAMQGNFAKNDESVGTLHKEMGELKAYIDDTRAIQETNQERIKLVLSELSLLIDSINSDYVSKGAFEKLERRVEELVSSKKTSLLLKKSGAELLKDGVALFEKKAYDDAKLRFERLLEMNFKPARSNFYLGEIAYFQGRFKTAIEHFKKSISIFDRADYMPILLYHTGISFSKLKNHEEARRFFDALKQGYPDSKEAKSLK